eukprot:CAMPEP_0195510592 /NCGR_PEP_ID=MMETSP0794_2-20130614/3194_1 /TAXON_ID=515487 /ORGANISM="Stephanopyxis turris, Strain CCMP 815" /LENGTH=284 /DNA_ID=CAMNT_0040638043 /DNA_START=159 /DNA_END=1013 /DNA_ORIENTATION=+
MPNYTRPGVAAAARLALITSKSTWEQIEKQYSELIVRKGGKKLLEMDKFRDSISAKLRNCTDNNSVFISRDELLEIVQWKFAKGKPRYALMKHLTANSEKDVKTASKTAFQKAKKNDIRGAVQEFCKLRGVGPATASCFLSMYREDYFAFMDDEVIECLYEGKRGYTLNIYLNVNTKCAELAKGLGGGCWTPYRAGRALWTASQISSFGLEDLTLLGEAKSDEVKIKTTKKKVEKGTKSDEGNAKPTKKKLEKANVTEGVSKKPKEEQREDERALRRSKRAKRS